MKNGKTIVERYAEIMGPWMAGSTAEKAEIFLQVEREIKREKGTQ